MTKELEGRVALVTGGSRGIGAACALALADAGANVVISYGSNADAAKDTVGRIEAAGGKASAVQFDVKDPDAAKAAVAEIVKSQGGLHVLVANAGISIDGLMMRVKDDDLEKLYRTNVFGAFYCARAASRPMMKAKWGRIIFMGSVVGETGNAGQSAYAGTKAALEGMAKSIARELASRSVTANVVTPGFIATDMTNAMPDAAKDATVAAIPMGRIGDPEDIAEAVRFLASDRAKYITGQVLGVNGGMYM